MAKTVSPKTVFEAIRAAGKDGIVFDSSRMCRRYGWDTSAELVRRTVNGLNNDNLVRRFVKTDGGGKLTTFVAAA